MLFLCLSGLFDARRYRYELGVQKYNEHLAETKFSNHLQTFWNLGYYIYSHKAAICKADVKEVI